MSMKQSDETEETASEIILLKKQINRLKDENFELSKYVVGNDKETTKELIAYKIKLQGKYDFLVKLFIELSKAFNSITENVNLIKEQFSQEIME